ncbi:MAG TPA: hypothetical protein ENN91_00955 [Firmicutes bacterium]|nr:hypothetical protein [Bacillota bacterium]
MAEDRKLKLTDDLIRQALELEFQSVETPSAERVWRRIESELAKSGASRPVRIFTWSRAAVVAAACLIIAIGGMGIWRAMQQGASVADTVVPADSEESAGIMEVEEARNGEISLSEAQESDSEDHSNELFLFGEPDPDPPPWPPELGAGMVLREAIILSTAGEPHYRGAFYCRGDICLLRVSSEAEEETFDDFIDHLGEHILLLPGEREELNGMVFFTLAGRPALAWQEDGLQKALIAISGSFTMEELIEIKD